MLNSGCSCLHPATGLPPRLINHWDIHGYPLDTGPPAKASLIPSQGRRTLPWSPQTGRSSSRPLSSAAAGPVGAQLPHSPTKWRWSKVPPHAEMPTVAAECGLESLKRLEVLLQAKAQLCLMHDFSHVGSFVKQSQMFECLLTRSVCDEATGYYAFVGTKLGTQLIISGQCDEPFMWILTTVHGTSAIEYSSVQRMPSKKQGPSK